MINHSCINSLFLSILYPFENSDTACHQTIETVTLTHDFKEFGNWQGAYMRYLASRSIWLHVLYCKAT